MKLSKNIRRLKDALNVLESIPGKVSIFKTRERIALPDECLVFKTASDRDRALLFYAVLEGSPMRRDDAAIAFSDESSYVFYDGKWIDVDTLSSSITEPRGLKMIFNKNMVSRFSYTGIYPLS